MIPIGLTGNRLLIPLHGLLLISARHPLLYRLLLVSLHGLLLIGIHRRLLIGTPHGLLHGLLAIPWHALPARIARCHRWRRTARCRGWITWLGR